jgi:hypothetical protein
MCVQVVGLYMVFYESSLQLSFYLYKLVIKMSSLHYNGLLLYFCAIETNSKIYVSHVKKKSIL